MSSTPPRPRAHDPEAGSPDKVRVALGSAVGTTIENYDFLAYGTAAALYFGPAFFPGDSPLFSTLAAFGTLGVGFAMRPIGGIIGGHLGDRIGRKPVLVGALLLMGFATVGIGLLPTYDQVGILAPILLVLLRLLQGIGFGAEWGGAILMTFEHAPRRRRGFYSAIPQAGVPLGLLLANVAFLLSAQLDSHLAWRVPFLLSAVLILAGFVIRMKVSESPEFEEAQQQDELVKSPVLEVLRKDWRTVLRAIALRLAETGGFYVTVTYLLSYLQENDLATRGVALTGIVLASLIGVFGTPLFGALSDRVGRRPVYLAGCVLTILYGVPLFLMMNTGDAVVIVIGFVIALAVAHDSLAGVQASWFSELFDTRTRTSGASLGYQGSAALSGFIPFIATALAAALGWMGVALLYSAVGLIGAIGVALTRDTWGRAERAAAAPVSAGR
ncbi:MFS transporter [Marinitenerispora sediminis]|uniref:MFS transporter n=1 Tax=Marinitenerispora sediminis TaxID=1931232 RepID=A0A368TBG5_9ACTN|nr:MFS transporter [Marinitenerispora sediminis]RCV50419.1 MFS transporter [Marinitenerispora sediminis]RCV55307.1 MFS transporter [Marinitenerispora sediminis]RCV62489.1 MFS transporter [Marinitenerispora sediminis]